MGEPVVKHPDAWVSERVVWWFFAFIYSTPAWYLQCFCKLNAEK